MFAARLLNCLLSESCHQFFKFSSRKRGQGHRWPRRRSLPPGPEGAGSARTIPWPPRTET